MSPKRLKFVDEYLIGGNATKAAIRAGFSEKTAKSQGQRLLTFVDVQKKIAEGQELARKQAEISREEVLGVLAAIIRADVPSYLNNEGKLKDLSALSGKEKKAIESIKVGKKGILTLKLSSKLQAINLINKLMGYESVTNINLKLEDLTDSELDKVIERMTSRNR